jgi:quinoprotein glucose dehydrogenase
MSSRPTVLRGVNVSVTSPTRGASVAVIAVMAATAVLGSAQPSDWTAYGRDAGGERFSPLEGIRRENVASLEVAWTFRTGDAHVPKVGRPTAHEATPLHIDDTLFLNTPLGRVIALDPVTGNERWAFDSKTPRDKGWGDYASRGVAAWRRGNDRRIFVATIDARLIALDAATGKPVASFGEEGTVDLRTGLRIPPTGFADYAVTSPPAVVGDAIVVGSAVADGTDKPHPSGEVRAFHAVTGKLLWTWDPVPQDAGVLGADTWKSGSARRVGGANAWSVMVADVSRNLIFVPTSSPSHDYFGGERLGDNLFSDSVVALRADTGERVWHFQTVHHDLWDYDVASPPILFDWRKDERTVPAIAAASKNGHVFILDRRSGEPLIPVEERPVPRSDVPGETSSPTQPFPAAPPSLARTTLTAEDAWGATEEDRAWCRRTIGALRSEGLFTPPSLQGSLVIPGNVGGVAWGGMAHDRVNDLLVMGVNDLAAEVRLVPRDREASDRSAGRLGGAFEFHPQHGTAYGVVRRFLLAPSTRLPCTPPPWGTLVAVKAATGEIAWRVPLGKLPWADSFSAAPTWGSIALGGPIVTAGGLVFAAGTMDPSIYAFDVATGRQLWRGSLPTSARATPMTYRGRDGRQFVVVSAGGHAVEGGPPLGDYIVAFAPPTERP